MTLVAAPTLAYGRPPQTLAARENVATFEKVLVVAVLLVFLGAFRTLLQAGGDDRSDGSTIFQVVSGSMYLTAIVVVLARGIPGVLFRILARGWPLVLLTLLAVASTLWSQDPGPTLRRAIALTLSTSFVFYIAIRFNLRTFFNLLTIAFAIFIGATIAAVLIPGQGVTPGGTYAGAWQGFTGNKNELGRSLALTVALMLPAALLNLTDHRRTALAVGLISLPLLFLSKSATSLVSAVLALGLGTAVYVLFGGPLARVKLRTELRVTLGVIAIVSGIALFTVAWTPLLEALGRDPTLTGRTKLWDWAIALNADRRWFGSGYRSFWIDENTRYFFLTFAWNMGPDGERSDSYAGPTHAHSGYVDLLLELGVVGIGAFATLLISCFATLRRVLAERSLALGFIFAAIIVFLLVYAVTARSILQQSEALWSLFGLLYLFSIKETLSARST